MCSIILRIDEAGVHIAANRDEMVARPWSPPAAHWPDLPGVIAGQDLAAGGTWLGMNAHGVVAAVLNRHGSLGPAAGKRSRGELPLLALTETTAHSAAGKIATLDAGLYRSFNLVTADRFAAYFLAGLESGGPQITPLARGVTMVTSGEPNEIRLPRIARHLPRFQAAGWAGWQKLLSDNAPPWDSALNIPERAGFGTVCASLIALPRDAAATWRFAAGPPDITAFETIRPAAPQP